MPTKYGFGHLAETFMFTEFVTSNLKIKKVIFNNPATIVFWEDNTKTVVQCGPLDNFDPEKGLAMAIAKKALGNKGNYYNEIYKYVNEYYVRMESQKNG